MSFTYDFTTNPQVAYVRLLIPDTTNALPNTPIFTDEEITAFYFIQASQFQSSMFFSGPAGRTLPSTPLSYLRVAALALDTMASNAAQVSIISQLLDVHLSPQAASAMLAARADNYRKVDDESGAFAIIEQCNTVWATRDRWRKQLARQTGGGGGL